MSDCASGAKPTMFDGLLIDFETFSACDLKALGAHLYAQHPTTDVHCLGYTLHDADEPKLWVRGEPIPEDIEEYLRGDGLIYAWNAPFEIAIWAEVMVKRYQWPEIPLDRWVCLMATAASWGMPLSLDAAAKFVGVENKKDKVGHSVMMKFARPRRIEEDGTPVWWHDDAKSHAEMVVLYRYCLQDLWAERDLARAVPKMSKAERQVWLLDQKINQRGVGVDIDLAVAAMETAQIATDASDARVEAITGGDIKSVRQLAKMKAWVEERGIELPHSLDKNTLPGFIATNNLPDDVAEILRHRVDFSRSSTAKFRSVVEGSAGGRMYGILQYCAAHTGRWGGRRLQPQNLPRATPRDIDFAVECIRRRDVTSLDVVDGPVMDLLSRMVRPVIKAAPGKKLYVADYSAIEARVLAWLAGQQDLVEIFETGGDVYVSMAAKIYKVPEAQVDRLSRQLGKTAILGLGYGMGKDRFFETCRLQGVNVGEELAREAVDIYRSANRHIIAFWADLDNAARDALANPGGVFKVGKVAFAKKGSNLLCQLPSGRKLMYAYPYIGSRTITYVDEEGVEQTKERHGVIYQGAHGFHVMWGGVWTENIVQAVARDLLAEAMLRIEAAGFPIVLHVHDEIVAEVDESDTRLDEFCQLMAEAPAWAKGCPIDVEGGEMIRYGKP